MSEPDVPSLTALPPAARLALNLPGFGTFFKPDELHRVVEAAQILESAGADELVMPDHVVMGGRTDRYPYGTFPYPAELPWLEALTTLAAIAGATTTVGLHTGILVVPLRPAPLLAKTAATIDVGSRGRLSLGVGAGWQIEEFDASGIPFEKRGQILNDTIGACRSLWGPSPSSFSSPTVNFDGIFCEPSPVRPGGIPVLFAGKLNGRTVRRIVEMGNGWHPPVGMAPDDIARGVEQLRVAYGDAGRLSAEVMVHHSLAPVRVDGAVDLNATMVSASALASAGVTTLSMGIASIAGTPDALEPATHRVVDAFRSAIG